MVQTTVSKKGHRQKLRHRIAHRSHLAPHSLYWLVRPSPEAMAAPTSTFPPRHKRNNSTGSVPSIGMCSFASFSSFNFDGHDSVFRAGSGGGGGGGDGDDSIVSEFERMIGSSSNLTSSATAAGSNSGKHNGMTTATMAHLPLILPSPKQGGNAGPLRQRLHAVDTLNLPALTPGNTAAASNRSRHSSTAATTATPSTPSQIGEIILGAAASPAPSHVTMSTLGTNGTPVSRTAMRDLLDTLNTLEGGGGDDVSSFGGSIGQSTIASRFQSPAAASGSRSTSAKSSHHTVASSSSSAASSRPPRALNIPARIPRPVSSTTATSSSSMPPIHQQKRKDKNASAPRHVLRTNAGPKKSKNSNKSNAQEKSGGFQIPTIAREVEADTKVIQRAPPQSVLADNDNRRSNANAGGTSKLPPMKARGKQKSQSKQSGAFPTTFGGRMVGSNNENVGGGGGGKKASITMPPTKPHSRVKSTKIYTTTRSNQPPMQKKLPPPLRGQHNQHGRRQPDAVLPGSKRSQFSGSRGNDLPIMHNSNATTRTLAEF